MVFLNSLFLNSSRLQQREIAESTTVSLAPSDFAVVFSQHVYLRYAKYFIHAAYLTEWPSERPCRQAFKILREEAESVLSCDTARPGVVVPTLRKRSTAVRYGLYCNKTDR